MPKKYPLCLLFILSAAFKRAQIFRRKFVL